MAYGNRGVEQGRSSNRIDHGAKDSTAYLGQKMGQRTMLGLE